MVSVPLQRTGDRSIIRFYHVDRSRSPVKKNVEISENLKTRLEELYESKVLTRGDLGDSFLEHFADLDEKAAIYVIDRIKTTDFSRVRSVQGFCIGIIRRVKDFGTEENEPDFTVLGEEVKERLEKLIADGKFDKSDIDLRVVRVLKRIPEEDRKVALDRYEDSLDDGIRSKQGFFMGILKRMLPDRQGGGGRGRYGGRGERRDHGGRGEYRSRFDRGDDRYGRNSHGSRDRHRDSGRYDRY